MAAIVRAVAWSLPCTGRTMRSEADRHKDVVARDMGATLVANTAAEQ